MKALIEGNRNRRVWFSISTFSSDGQRNVMSSSHIGRGMMQALPKKVLTELAIAIGGQLMSTIRNFRCSPLLEHHPHNSRTATPTQPPTLLINDRKQRRIDVTPHLCFPCRCFLLFHVSQCIQAGHTCQANLATFCNVFIFERNRLKR